MSTGRRVHERYQLEIPVTVVVPTTPTQPGTEIQGKTQNVSLGGMLITVPSSVTFGTEVKLRLRLTPLKEDATVTAFVRWLAPGAIGVQFGSLRAKEVWALNQLFKDAPPV
jgi:c-di-GMP-binding flagellar brake protein YcgR